MVEQPRVTYLPAVHVVHEEQEAWLLLVVYFPALQSEQPLLLLAPVPLHPAVDTYFPASHVVHVKNS